MKKVSINDARKFSLERVQVTPRGQGGGDTYELHIHTSAPVTQETVVSGFYMARALAGARA